MRIYLSDNTLYINIEDRINFSLITKLKRKLYKIVDSYQIPNIEINLLNNEYYDKTLIDDLLNDYNNHYNGTIIVK